MAKAGSFSARFPHAKLFLFLAVLIALPLTVFSVQKVPTNTEQHAASSAGTCTSNGGACYKYDCPQGYVSIGGSCGNIFDSACCTQLKVPTGLYGSVIRCDPKGVVNFNWNTVKYADKYYLYYKYTTATKYTSRTLGNVTHYFLALNNMQGRRLNWYVKAGSSNASGPKSTTYTTPYTANIGCH